MVSIKLSPCVLCSSTTTSTFRQGDLSSPRTFFGLATEPSPLPSSSEFHQEKPRVSALKIEICAPSVRVWRSLDLSCAELSSFRSKLDLFVCGLHPANKRDLKPRLTGHGFLSGDIFDTAPTICLITTVSILSSSLSTSQPPSLSRMVHVLHALLLDYRSGLSVTPRNLSYNFRRNNMKPLTWSPLLNHRRENFFEPTKRDLGLCLLGLFHCSPTCCWPIFESGKFGHFQLLLWSLGSSGTWPINGEPPVIRHAFKLGPSHPLSFLTHQSKVLGSFLIALQH